MVVVKEHLHDDDQYNLQTGCDLSVDLPALRKLNLSFNNLTEIIGLGSSRFLPRSGELKLIDLRHLL